MKRGREDAADEPKATIRAEQSAAVAAAVVGAAESAIAATAGGAATAVPAPAAITAVEPPVGEHKVGEDLEEEEEKRLKCELHDQIEKEFYEANAINEFDEDFRKGSDFDADAIDELSEEDDNDVDYDMDSKHNKSRYTLRHLIASKIKYRFWGKIGCPFCCKVIEGGMDGLIQHAVDTGNGRGTKHKASTLAKHAAYGRFLQMIKGNVPYYIPPHRAQK